MALPYKLGSNDANTGGEITPFGEWFQRFAKSYAPPVDGYFGNAERDAVRILQRNLGVPITGEFDEATASHPQIKYKIKGVSVPTKEYRPIWAYSAPGSGAPGNVGPAYQLGERCKKILNINHQWVGYPIGGYLGFMGGDPKHSYNDVAAIGGFFDRELERLLWINPDLLKALAARQINPKAKVDFETWFFAYSQSADAMRRTVQRLFGDGGPFELLRDCINGLVLFGDPSTPVTGISRLTFEPWLERLVTEINYPNDFYAVAKDKIRPAMFGIIVEADMELPFFVHVIRLAMRIIPSWLGLIGIGSPLQSAGGLLSQANSNRDTAVDDQIYAILSPMGLLLNILDLIGLLAALPGLQAHGGYEFDPVMMNRAYDKVAGFRR